MNLKGASWNLKVNK